MRTELKHNLPNNHDEHQRKLVMNHFRTLTAAQNGWLDALKVIIEQDAFQPLSAHIDGPAHYNLLVSAAASNGHLDVVKWLIADSGLEIDLSAQNNFTLRVAIDSGELNLVKWLVIHSGQEIDISKSITYTSKLVNNAKTVELADQYADIADFLQATYEWVTLEYPIDFLRAMSVEP